MLFACQKVSTNKRAGLIGALIGLAQEMAVLFLCVKLGLAITKSQFGLPFAIAEKKSERKPHIRPNLADVCRLMWQRRRLVPEEFFLTMIGLRW
jgi:hypothetical protein